VQNKPACLAAGIDADGEKYVPGIWLDQDPCVPCQRTFLFVNESCSSGILCHSTFPDSPPAQQRVRP
jgi:hypothetical protein